MVIGNMAKNKIRARPKKYHNYEILFTTSVFSLDTDDVGCHGNQKSMNNIQLRVSMRDCP